ncbi:hypothetical protein K6Y31_05985 [Motilimonas cestriensis]|uniref:Uncharacterized protein n=1 Tax=Motilimonas cestriensis TaxID=2742685 RepID=A0ABS8W5W4_9GAMM|nr:hypothetical protein [Motilimonas cestriensis]MCE2594359.1 hypothetical protein [Motilimonas cestriensis]
MDEQDWQGYAGELAQHLPRLHQHVQSGRYRAKAIKREWIPKAGGCQHQVLDAVYMAASVKTPYRAKVSLSVRLEVFYKLLNTFLFIGCFS